LKDHLYNFCNLFYFINFLKRWLPKCWIFIWRIRNWYLN